MAGQIWQGKGFQKAQAGRPQARDFKGMAFPSSELLGATQHPRTRLASGLRKGEER